MFNKIVSRIKSDKKMFRKSAHKQKYLQRYVTMCAGTMAAILGGEICIEKWRSKT